MSEEQVKKIESMWRTAVDSVQGKILVLDDDPTGIQTVHSIPVYTDWEEDTVRDMFADPCKVIFILTNSRALSAEQTTLLHQSLAGRISRESVRVGVPFLLMSRSDSTLRGHYPLETECLFAELNRVQTIDGEIIAPAFPEGGRVTMEDVHYVREGEKLTPAGETEFARDAVFGYRASNLREWIEEKTQGKYSAGAVTSISLAELRSGDIDGITAKLQAVEGFGKVVVNAVDYDDLKVFVIALVQAMTQGKRFLFRTAAGLVRVLGGIDSKPLLDSQTLYPEGKSSAPGLIVIGSHVRKTTEQFEKLAELANMELVAFDVLASASAPALAMEVQRVIEQVGAAAGAGRDSCVFTTREYQRGDVAAEKSLDFSNRVSAGLVSVVRGLKTRPGFLVAKGGVTSSDIGVKGLGVRRAMVLGQIQPGVPVWLLGPESRFPGLPYVIFPGNVGGPETLKTVVEILRK